MKKALPTSLADFAEGQLVLIDKPLGWTSFDVVKRLRGKVKAKMGHAGTLDPLATGLLLLATGKYTKKLGELSNSDKIYSGSFRLGATTASYDAESPPENEQEWTHITEAQIKQVFAEFTGAIEQVPPAFSAIKIEGKPAYLHARQGQQRLPKARSVNIFELELTKTSLPDVYFKVHCSKGTYIRSLAHDIGQQLGPGAYLTSLRRESIGDFKLNDAWNLDDFIEAVFRLSQDA